MQEEKENAERKKRYLVCSCQLFSRFLRIIHVLCNLAGIESRSIEFWPVSCTNYWEMCNIASILFFLMCNKTCGPGPLFLWLVGHGLLIQAPFETQRFLWIIPTFATRELVDNFFPRFYRIPLVDFLPSGFTKLLPVWKLPCQLL